MAKCGCNRTNTMRMPEKGMDVCAVSEALCSPELEKKRSLLQQITECEFICIDINLYLDTHPNDARALSDYNCYAEQLRALKDIYMKNYGPLENFGNSVSRGSWKWNIQPFPWNNKYMRED